MFNTSAVWRARLLCITILALAVGVAQGQWTTLFQSSHNFGSSSTDGRTPSRGAVVFDTAGNAYGATEDGGANGCGMLWKLTPGGVYTDVHDFGNGTDGVAPVAGVTIDAAGDLFGTTAYGGAYDNGMVWELTASNSYVDLYDFGSGMDGYEPCGGVTLDASGDLYGTTLRGGANDLGIVWELSSSLIYTDLHDFGSGYDGWNPEAGVTLDSSGNLYGTTYGGGVSNTGIVWELTTTGTYSILHTFSTTTDGASPIAGVTFDALGNMYGTTESGGFDNSGIFWQISSSGTYKILHYFGSGLDGKQPWGGVTVDVAGDLFGTTTEGGGQFAGTIWEYSNAGAYSTMYDFGPGPDGTGPAATIALDSAGNMYGTSAEGGNNGVGSIWKVLSWVKSVSIPSSVVGGQTVTGTVTLTQAPLGNLTVALSSNAPGQFPATTVTVPKGSTSATFNFTPATVGSATNVVVTASYQAGFARTNYTVSPPTVTSVVVNPTSVVGGNSSTGTVTLDGPAATNGQTVSLSSNSSSATVPSSVTVQSGQTTATFNVTTAGVSASTPAKITAGGQSATLTITPAALSGVSVNPTSVIGGTSSTGTVTLTGFAPSGGITVLLSSSKTTVATVPASVAVAAGSNSATFLVRSIAQNTSASSTIAAKYGSIEFTTPLAVTAQTLSYIKMSPTTVVGGNSSTGTVALTGPAPTGGVVVTLSSGNSAVTVPASVTILAGHTGITFTATTVAVAANVSATLTATAESETQQATLTVTAPTLKTNTLNPTSVVGGNSSIGTVTISSAAPATGLSIALSSNLAGATVGTTVTVAGGATTGTYTVNTAAVTATATATITAKLGAGSVGAKLTITK